MKNLFTLLVFLITVTISAQAPQGFNYQATVRNNAGALMINKNVTFKFNVIKDTPTSVPVFSETHYVPTDDLGAVNLVIGKGTATSGTFATIDWATGTYYLGIELNTGNDFVAMGTTQLLSVPYAIYASNSGSASIPNLATVLAKNNSANNTKITNLADPTDAQDAVTKAYLAANSTNLVSGTTNGDLLYWNGTQWAILNAPLNNANLKWCNGQLTWGNCPGDFASHLEAQNFFNTSVLPAVEGPYLDNIDISGSDLDPTNTNYVRSIFYLNDLSTDVALINWNDPGLQDILKSTCSSSNIIIKGIYLRLNKIIEKSNEFIKKSENIKYDPIVRQLIGEARFMRALAYYSFIDLYGRAPIVTETTATTPTAQNTRQELFNFIESELLILEDIFGEPWNISNGRMSKAIPQALLTRLYLNTQSFIGMPKYSQCIQYCEKIFNYANHIMLQNTDLNANGSKYDELFLADNGETSAKNEVIYSIKHTGLKTNNTELVNFGGTTFLTNSAAAGTGNILGDFGVNGWGGALRAKKNLMQKFTASVTATNNNQEPIAWSDKRANFLTDGTTYNDANNFYGVKKWVNKKINNQNGSHPVFVDIDFPVIRLAEIFLNYAEAHLRGGGGDINTATNYVNQLRNRSNATSINPNDLNLNFILDERARELYWECLRRTDLVRYNLFTGGQYLWPFKGGTANGTSTDSFRNLYPIPQDVLIANPDFTQNPGY
jgi:starch-binding outer membrane protein, SusD/RagB family